MPNFAPNRGDEDAELPRCCRQWEGEGCEREGGRHSGGGAGVGGAGISRDQPVSHPHCGDNEEYRVKGMNCLLYREKITYIERGGH